MSRYGGEYEDTRDAEDTVRGLDGRLLCGSRVSVEMSNGVSRRSRFGRPPARRPFDPTDRCYQCGERGHYAYDCHLYGRRKRGGRTALLPLSQPVPAQAIGTNETDRRRRYLQDIKSVSLALVRAEAKQVRLGAEALALVLPPAPLALCLPSPLALGVPAATFALPLSRPTLQPLHVPPQRQRPQGPGLISLAMRRRRRRERYDHTQDNYGQPCPLPDSTATTALARTHARTRASSPPHVAPQPVLAPLISPTPLAAFDHRTAAEGP